MFAHCKRGHFLLFITMVRQLLWRAGGRRALTCTSDRFCFANKRKERARHWQTERVSDVTLYPRWSNTTGAYHTIFLLPYILCVFLLTHTKQIQKAQLYAICKQTVGLLPEIEMYWTDYGLLSQRRPWSHFLIHKWERRSHQLVLDKFQLPEWLHELQNVTRASLDLCTLRLVVPGWIFREVAPKLASSRGRSLGIHLVLIPKPG